MKPKKAVKAANINYDTARKWNKKHMVMIQRKTYL